MTFSLKYQFSMTYGKKTKIDDFPGWFQISGFSMTVGTLVIGPIFHHVSLKRTGVFNHSLIFM